MRTFMLALLALVAVSATALADTTDPATAASPVGDPKVASSDDGKYFDANGNPTYNIGKNDRVDWYTFSGYRRFNGTCEVCHGFDGSGSSFAPDLTQSLKTIGYNDFQNVVVNGKQDVNTAVNLVMPSFGNNKNVMCYLDDIYVYLRARADGVQGNGRPADHEDKPKTATQNENDCMGP
ncbi:MAG: c-type cytochrome, methanol metabolism-related [Hyphomicrobium sp.]|uniref:c-type cytochrome, methanol metabolism-related n=1 Tax=Hyphomicrobium sp. TaxID=82 RepID=UPI003D11BC60